MLSESHLVLARSLPPLPVGCNFPSSITHYLDSNRGLTQHKMPSHLWDNSLSNNNRKSNGQRSEAPVELVFALSPICPPIKETFRRNGQVG